MKSLRFPHCFKFPVVLLAVSVFTRASHGAIAATSPDLHAVISEMIGESDCDFAGRKGAPMTGGGEGSKFFEAKPFEGMVGEQVVMESKTLTFIMVDCQSQPAMAAIHDAFFSMSSYPDAKGTYAYEHDSVATDARKNVTTLLLNGRKVANFMDYGGGKEFVMSVGPIGGRAKTTPASTTPADTDRENRILAFVTGTQFLIQHAGGNFTGLIGPLFRKTAEGDSLYNTVYIPEMQNDSDGQVILQFGNRFVYSLRYEDPAKAAFAFTAFQAIPSHFTTDKYEIELDQRLEKSTSSTYHLRYNGVIVADFVKHKNDAIALFSVGYRDGIPAGMIMGTGRTYSREAVEGAKQMINEATICPGCRGSGTEEVESKYVYKGSGLPKMVAVPCHYCHGLGHL